MAIAMDRNFFTQVGLDSGSLTMLGCLLHRFSDPGEYRCVVLSGESTGAVFYVTSDPECAVASANIDLAALAGAAPATAGGASGPDCGCGSGAQGSADGQHFVVHPRGHAVFHVSGGAGGYSVHARLAVEDRDVLGYDTTALVGGDIFSAVLMRPGRYSVRNTLSEARAEVTVGYPGTGQTAYKPPPPEVIDVRDEFQPARVALRPMQGLNFNIHTAARILIELEEPDDGPRGAAARTSAPRARAQGAG
jgi:hypothetical protein